ncbi:hypothetical protein MMPV_004023 [Pyropia vietnamensis]
MRTLAAPLSPPDEAEIAMSLRDLIDAGVVSIRSRSAAASTWDEPLGYTEPRTIILVGTSHVSVASALDVARVIAVVRPATVVVELCRRRTGLLDEMPPRRSSAEDADAVEERTGGGGGGGDGGVGGRNKEGAPTLGVVQGAAAALGGLFGLGGALALALREALGASLGRATDEIVEASGKDVELTVASTGVDFRAARQAAAAVGAEMVLGDRPVEITLRRAWAALGFVERVRVVWDIVTDVGVKVAVAAQAAVSARPTEDDLDSFLAALAQVFPSLVSPLVTERDHYLAWSIKRSKAVEGVHMVVGVMGRAHCRGVLAAMDEDDAARAEGGAVLTFRDLVNTDRVDASASSLTSAFWLRTSPHVRLDGAVPLGRFH